MISSTVQKATGATTDLSKWFEIIGASHMTAKTPRRAMAISRPMARAISLLLNHLAMAFETVVPAISHPHPKIMKPSEAILALPGKETHQLSSQAQSPVPWNHSEMPTNLIEAPMTMSDAESRPVNRMPILSRMMPAKMRKKTNTLRKYSEAA